ncbi:hypothetical protein E3U43_020351 [Larimichthys crocea]|uniref:Uncharacterized protein n=1 Tax=Larimichthys crocea TaxID=215358 RepID=A0ACD3QW42_LARCR|nr:hypothetical protein E3U43_020351 [Larimichthys crocea]
MEITVTDDMSIMASDTVTGCPENTMTLQTDEDVSPVQQDLEDVKDRLVTISEQLDLCQSVLNDLKDLSDLLVRKSLQDVTLPQKK